MATEIAALADRLVEALVRRRATAERVPHSAVGPAAAAQMAEWGTVRALLVGDPLLDELEVDRALGATGCALMRWPEGRGAGWRDLLGLDGPAATCGVTLPLLAVAQRGTLVLATSPAHGRSIDVVSMYHLAILPASRIRETLAEALTEAYRGGGRVPSAVSLVSGPSRTSDIEKISTLGAHGALAMHVIVVDDL